MTYRRKGDTSDLSKSPPRVLPVCPPEQPSGPAAEGSLTVPGAEDGGVAVKMSSL
jgi:hypothetical protein